jgi:hypothetical protein
VRFRLLIHVDVEARDETEANRLAKKLGELIKNPFVEMSLRGDGIHPVAPVEIYKAKRV